MGRKAFIDPVSNVLKAHGFTAANQAGDVAIEVDESFSLHPGMWRWTGVTWAPYVPPLTQEEIDVSVARSDNAINTLKAMTPAQARAWVNTNVNSLADAKQLLGTMAAVLCVLARRV